VTGPLPDGASRIEAIRAKHWRLSDDLQDPVRPVCDCGDYWPCEAADLLDAYDAAAKLVDLLSLTEAHTVESAYTGAYATMPQGHLLLGDGRRSLAVLDFGGTVDVGGIRVTDPAVLRTAGEHLLMLAGRLEDRQAPTAPQFVDGFNPAAPVERTSWLGGGL
jgi:hypothetical protein